MGRRPAAGVPEEGTPAEGVPAAGVPAAGVPTEGWRTVDSGVTVALALGVAPAGLAVSAGAAGTPAAGVPTRAEAMGVADRGVPKRHGPAVWSGAGAKAGDEDGVALRSGGAYTGVLRAGVPCPAVAWDAAAGVGLLDTPRAGVAREVPPPKAGTAAAALAGVMETGSVPPLMAITPPQTEQRARTPVAGTLAGSTRNTERHSGQLTFTPHLRPSGCRRVHGYRGWRP